MPTLCGLRGVPCRPHRDRKSTRLNSSHTVISYAVFCLKKKKTSLNSSHTVISYAGFCLKKNTKLRNGLQRSMCVLPPPSPVRHNQYNALKNRIQIHSI